MSAYQELVVGDDNAIRGHVVYGLYERARREWPPEYERSSGRPSDPAAAAAYEATWTPQQLANARNAADAALVGYAEAVIADARAGIVQEALKGTFWGGVGVCIFSSALYTLMLFAIVVVLKFAGVDLIAALQAIPARR